MGWERSGFQQNGSLNLCWENEEGRRSSPFSLIGCTSLAISSHSIVSNHAHLSWGLQTSFLSRRLKQAPGNKASLSVSPSALDRMCPRWAWHNKGGCRFFSILLIGGYGGMEGWGWGSVPLPLNLGFKRTGRGVWMAQSFEPPTADFNSRHDPIGCEIKR